MTDYNEMTQQDFDEILLSLVGEMYAGDILYMPGVYEIVAEELNNEVLDLWRERQESDD